MPLILRADERARWLDVSCELDSDDPLFAPVLKMPLRVQPVSRGVNNARNKAVDLMTPLGDGFLLTAGAE